ncbi:hypothetical protein KKJ06_12930 [Xenorhabdus bovienii]|uniref:hypothetical protein n=1 Tax=Xenorhabdus bovienii TaxID=40576 RepID=UPI0023B313F4|nr:hypothetical protein [Xenorhabdus bovienii]MDE9482435.1 hypothetical protein [Xenorhabdus bovienii]MDE9556311.1 hypothetical protein [Xenorhabdus bovienii]MDE9566337.1 hypothetical protein [Xenorhabdus bovienii]
MFFILPIFSLEKHFGLTSSPHFPLSAGYITPSAYDGSLPLKAQAPAQPDTVTARQTPSVRQ